LGICGKKLCHNRAEPSYVHSSHMPPQDHTQQYGNVDIPYDMSLSPTTSNVPDGSSKRRRTDSEGFAFQTGIDTQMTMTQSVSNGPQPNQQAIPKRGQRACTACRKGKNRCEGDVSKPETGFRHTDGPASPRPARRLFIRLPVVDAN
jgi:hypothetical protein